jgi:lipopolysaccharide/colanic/teichoic acid biosynthesis glycosyltransferase
MTGNSRRTALTATRLEPVDFAPVTQATLRGHYERWGKPVVDRLVGVLLCILAAPVLAVVAALVYLRLGSPVLLRQQRVGQHGERFTVYKFRTMLPDRRSTHVHYPGPDRRVTHKHPDDPRHTPFGRMLRRYSLDELPQLVNVARGDMSLVGPRPELPAIVATYQPWQHERHTVKPGLSGLWQVTERGNGLMHQHTEIDLRYARNVSLRGDLWILANTIPALLGRRCAGT